MAAKTLALLSLAATAAASSLRTGRRATSVGIDFPLVAADDDGLAAPVRAAPVRHLTVPLALVELKPEESAAIKGHMDAIKGRPPPAPKTQAEKGDPMSTEALRHEDAVENLHATTKVPGVTSAKPRAQHMCSSGDQASVRVHVDTEGLATEGFQVQAVVTDKATGQTAPLSAVAVVPSGPFWLGQSPALKAAAAKGGVPAAERSAKSTQDLVVKATPGATLLGPAEYELHLQIVSPDPEAIASDISGQMVGETKYNYGRMQTLLDQVVYVPLQIEDCGTDPAKTDPDRPASVTLRAEVTKSEADSYFKLGDVGDAAETAFARLSGDHIKREQVADFKMVDGDRPGRSLLSLRLVFSNRALAHVAAIDMMKEKEHWQDILFGTMKQTLIAVGAAKWNPAESQIRHFVIEEEPFEEDNHAKSVCCLAKSAACEACKRGIGVDAFCVLEPQTPGCSSPKDPSRDATVSQFLVQMVLQIKTPNFALGIWDPETGVGKVSSELTASMQSSIAVLNYADPDMTVKSVKVETAKLGPDAKETPLVEITVASSTHANAQRLANILHQSSVVQKDYMGKALTEAFRANKVRVLRWTGRSSLRLPPAP